MNSGSIPDTIFWYADIECDLCRQSVAQVLWRHFRKVLRLHRLCSTLYIWGRMIHGVPVQGSPLTRSWHTKPNDFGAPADDLLLARGMQTLSGSTRELYTP